MQDFSRNEMPIQIETPKIKITCIQMDSKLACPDENFSHAENLI